MVARDGIEQHYTLLTIPFTGIDLNLAVLDVAVACGFKTQQHFAQVFRDAWGVSPTEYRQYLVGSEATNDSETNSEDTPLLVIGG